MQEFPMPFWYELTQVGFSEAVKQTEVAVMVTGALEAHGTHLGLGTDIVNTEYLANKIATDTNALVLPTIPFGDSWGFEPFSGTVTVKPKNLVKIYADVMESVFRTGFRFILALNGHGPNAPLLQQAAKKTTKKGERTVVIVNWWKDLAIDARSIVLESPEGHAAEDETSELMHVRPDMVDMSAPVAARVTPRFSIISAGFREELLPSAVYGDPRKATAEKGRLIMEQAGEEIIALVNQLEKGELPLEKEE